MDNQTTIGDLKGTEEYEGECMHIIHHCRKIPHKNGKWTLYIAIEKVTEQQIG